ncbi:MAG TPA: hypothetical protein VFA89_20785 [Terriglobales bacterium]|nr:hypothetical protein [Terriglobales bacterium]
MVSIPVNIPLAEKQIIGTSETGAGIVGSSGSDSGVHGDSRKGAGVQGFGIPGVKGESSMGDGVLGQAGTGAGVSGLAGGGTGVLGKSTSGRGVWGVSDGFIATVGDSTTGTGVWGHSITGTGVYGWSERGIAGHFEGDVEVTGDIRLQNGDCAEEFETADALALEPGTVVVIDQSGSMVQSHQAYDRKVAGVISGAGDLKPGIVLGRKQSRDNRIPIALLGQVNCKVDAQYGAIEIGDLLTTSSTPGHAMKVDDPIKAFGTVIGKALRTLESGRGFIPILVALQ